MFTEAHPSYSNKLNSDTSNSWVSVRNNLPHFSEFRFALVDHEYPGFATSLVHYATRLGHLPLLRMGVLISTPHDRRKNAIDECR